MLEEQSIKSIKLQRYIEHDKWKIFRAFSFLRLILAILIGCFFIFKISYHQQALVYYIDWAASTNVAIIYGGFTLISLFLQWQRKMHFEAQVYVAIIGDIILLTVLIYFNDIITLSLVILINSIIAGGCLMMRGKKPLFFAVIASLAISGVYIAKIVMHHQMVDSLVFLALISLSYFLTALLMYKISRNIDLTRKLTVQQAKDISGLKNLNAMVIEHMRVGILVLNEKYDIELINPAAKKLLHCDSDVINPKFLIELKKINTNKSESFCEMNVENKKLLINIMFLSNGCDNEYIIFVEDGDFAEQRVQQLKLASLGELTASIAHEIRNPLSVIIQASELLMHNCKIDSDQKKLNEMIARNARRINNLIVDILQLAKRKRDDSSPVELITYVQEFIAEQQNTNLQLITTIEHVNVVFEKQQLQQVLINLYENASRYNDPLKKIIIQIEQKHDSVYLHMIDHGQGFQQQDVYKIFEPFYTTETTGTGLGLYISKELCRANRATLIASNQPLGGACLKIGFKKI